MADVLVKSKEAIVIVLDVGCSMQYACKQVPTILSKAKACINMILQRKIFSESKDEIALVLFGTLETANKLATSDTLEYNHIVVAQDLKPASWELLQFVHDIEGSERSADFIDALVVAMDILRSQSKGQNFSSLRILFFSNFDADFCQDQLNTICDGLKNIKMELNVIGPFAISDDEYVTSDLKIYNSKTPEQIKAEAVVRELLKAVNGESYTFEEALPALVYYQKKKVQSLPWNANLDIGKNLTIPISAYIKVYENKPKPWKNAFAHKLTAKIEKETTCHLNDEALTEVPKESIIPAYRYGTTLVPFSVEDKVNMEYQSGEKGMKVLGFTKEENVYRYYYIGDKTMYVFGQKNRELAGVILAPFIQALYETKMVAIVRYVYSARSAPKIGFLSPRIKPNYECLVFIVLPFMEDLRHFVFAPLDSYPKNLPTDEQLSTVDELISAMDLSVAASDEEGNKGEALKAKNTVNPHLQRLYQCLQHRVFHPDSSLPEIPPHIRTVIDPSPELLAASEHILKKMKRIFPLSDGSKKRPYEGRSNLFSNGKPSGDEEQAVKKICSKGDNISDSIVEAVDDKVIEVGTVSPVEDFQHLVSLRTDTEWFEEICKQLGKAVMRLLSDAMINMQEDKILSCLSAFRIASIKKEQPTHFNDFMKSLKGTLISRSNTLWMKIIDEKLGLITSAECFPSTVTFQEASEFNANLPEENVERMDEDEKDLLEEL